MKTYTFALSGLAARFVDVHAAVIPGLAGLEIAGLSELPARELRIRVSSALEACGVPKCGVRVLLDSDFALRGVGDLAIAVAVAMATAYLSTEADGLPEGSRRDLVFLGELSLSGQIRPVRGVLPALLEARRLGVRQVVVPWANASEAAEVSDLDVRGASCLRDVLDHLRGAAELPTVWGQKGRSTVEMVEGSDLADLGLSPETRCALEVAAAGGHGILLVGPPGSGKTMLARRLAGILPEWSPELRQEYLCVRSVAGLMGQYPPSPSVRPFRAPHHTVSEAGLVGGGSPLRPGEVSLAHGGVLFLDEVTEFRRPALESLGRVLRAGESTFTREAESATFPARCVVVAAASPCPCGREARECKCAPEARARWTARIAECCEVLGIEATVTL